MTSHGREKGAVPAHTSPVGLQDVDDPDVQQQPLPFTVPGGDAAHAEEDRGP